ncbi:hypothetical protein BJ508DRAFT_329263 [Ascobolus immersus RN42]|uniref:F-box domain-containing protein n=1 Tax=Ascobolus immersus RN42 TaxID=1160509 RepID=A0A3N4HYZ4_ASCIM|nr:hypothetical protein BJ508DRAFT_329263 [Ascobolus immersus RN42]
MEPDTTANPTTIGPAPPPKFTCFFPKCRSCPRQKTASRFFLCLPAELRLEIYKDCTALTLPQLASTCTTIHAEINHEVCTLRASYGFNQRFHNAFGGTHRLMFISRVSNLDELHPTKQKSVNIFTSHPGTNSPQTKGHIKLINRDVFTLP